MSIKENEVKAEKNLENARAALRVMTSGVLDDLSKQGWE